MADVELLTFDDIAGGVFTRWDITGYLVNQHLLSELLTGTPTIVADVLTFPSGFIHHMHRHPCADMIVVPLGGSVRFIGEFDRTIDVKSGQLLVIPRHNWHEIRNVSDAPTQILHIFSGVGSLDDIGYEAHPTTLRLMD
jgi:quercetin dioxygenase-like cupin family protein